MILSRSLEDQVEIETYGGTEITPQMGVAGCILFILGLYLMSFGVRAFRPTLGVAGFLSFGTLTWIGLVNSRPSGGYFNDSVTMITVPAGLGVLGAVLYIVLERFTVYLVGALGGLALALYICSWQEDNVITQEVARVIFHVVLPLFMACITHFAERLLVLFSTSFVGAYVFFVGIDFLAHTGYLSGIEHILDHTHDAPYYISARVYVFLVMTSVLCLISLGWQHFFNTVSGGGDSAASRAPDEEAPAVTAAATTGGSVHSSGGNGGDQQSAPAAS